MLGAALAFLLAGAPVQEADAAKAAKAAEEPQGRAVAFRVDRIETLDGEPILGGTIVVRGGVIEKMGQAVILPEGAEVHDLRGGGSTLMPPLVVSHANFLQRDSRGSGRNGRYRAIDSLHLGDDDLADLLEEGVLLAGVDPPGRGIPGRTSVILTDAAPPTPEPVVSDLHLKLTVDANSSAKEILRKALADADKAIESEKKARENWKKAREEWEARQKAAKEKEKAEAKEPEAEEKKPPGRGPRQNEGEEKKPSGQKPEEKEPPKEFEPPKIDPNLLPVVEWVRKQRVAQVWLDNAAEWVHWKDVLGERELPYEVVLTAGGSFFRAPSTNFHEVLDQMGGAELRAYVPARLMYLPNTRIHVNLPAEALDAGVKLVLTPPADSATGLRTWRASLGRLVSAGLDRTGALRAVSLEPAAAMGQEEVVQALAVGSPATFIVLDGDVLDGTSEVEFVVRDGAVLYDREKEEAVSKEGSR